MYLITREGTIIERTLERLLGTCTLKENSVERAADGSYTFDYDGSGTDVDWDSQEAVVGKHLIDTEGDEYADSDCARCDDEDLELVEAALAWAGEMWAVHS